MDEAKQLPALKPCPFCGGEAAMKPAPYKRPHGANGITIECGSCHIQRTQRVLRQTMEWLESSMVTDWNARALAAHQPSAAEPVATDDDLTKIETWIKNRSGNAAFFPVDANELAGFAFCLIKEVRKHRAAPAAAAPPVAVPVGYALVPVMLTDGMVEAWASASAPSIEGASDQEANRLVAQADWSAMLAAVAPAAARVDVEGV